ncbi:uncharacterized protein Z520_03437 [Fonsecaea multimorphosa CBS 102226]|uniref:RNA-dependent RNA polymerase n=1 Tax=Fonsecaea multimorphosa CBS 102226 TaxID=1442371 RepID=A0A0D2IUP0_9EURO|nr:uncharacterized protein Z520_03437 [Fonsecaea multimorphosa CBS 102226]KIY00772.1 hypothetical protein Z520_03437 [Fonsecaea multimorphosa CBS 102226]OAL27870.1 hypothetical protein AYO22_03215 [Fonsecaea multimorphosa]
MPPTPKEISNNIDQAIDGLNAQWDLRLPRFHGGQTAPADESERLAANCSNKIRFLCFRTDITKTVLLDFEQRARHVYSDWVFKTSQVPGTLPVLPVVKSLVARKAGLVRPTDSQRCALVKLLDTILEENYQLARLSSDYSTEPGSTSAAPFVTAPTTPVREAVSTRQESFSTPSRNTLRKSHDQNNTRDEPQLKSPLTVSSKRTIGSPNGVSLLPEFEFQSAHILPQQNKRQQTLSEFRQFRPVSAPPPPEIRSLQVPDPISFESVISPAVSSIFSTADEGIGGKQSNDTSMVSSQAEDSPDLFPTQECMELFEDEQFSTSFSELSKAPTPFDPTDLESNGPFRKQAILPSHVPFWYCWELHRLAPLFGLRPIELYKKFEEIHKKPPASAEEFWRVVKEFCRAKALQPLPHKSDLPSWIVQDDKYMDEKTHRVAHFTAALDWNEDCSPSVLTLRLNPIQLVQSSRFYRKFGADRFLALDGPPFRLPDRLRRLSPKSVPSYDKVIDFLASNSHFIAGRLWRICFVEKSKNKTGRNKVQTRRSRIILFAETGFDIVPRPLSGLKLSDIKLNGQYQNITRQELMQWHMPLNANADSMDLKLFSRWSIGFSRTTPTIELKRHEFLYRHDELGDESSDGSKRKVMNDGCALMSYSLAKAIWAAYGGEGEPPSAVQGRISGGKGLWLVDYENKYAHISERGYWIEVSESQLKIKPHPRDRDDADDDAALRTFEVLKFAAECKQAQLNIQLINILEDRGVPREVFQEALQSDVQSFSKTLIEAMKDPRCLRLWMQEHAHSSRLEAKKVLGSFPCSNKEQMKFLLESGFHPQTCRKLITNAYRLLLDYMTNYVEKMWIQIPHSTAVFCAPDPLGVLAPGEVFLGSSTPITHPVTGLRETTLEGLELLVARNPAHLASDMQRCRAVYKHELRHYKNVILFSVKGAIPLASLLSGGDYDAQGTEALTYSLASYLGDVVTCIWDPDIVRHFRNTDMPQLPKEIECGMVQCSEPISETFKIGRPHDEAFEDYFRKCIAFNARPNLLGYCATEHEKLVYALSRTREPNKLMNSGAVKLAALAGFLVDSVKQGWELTEAKWHGVRRDASGKSRLRDPDYKARTASSKPGAYLNVIDYLKFDVAETLKEHVLREFVRMEKDKKVLYYDRDLSQRWHYWLSPIEEDKAENRRAGQSRSEQDTSHTAGSLRQPHKAPGAADLEILTDVLEGKQGLLEQIKAIKELWSTFQFRSEPTPNENKDWGEYSLAVATVYEEFRAIRPKRLDHELVRRYDAEKGRRFSEWDLLKASCLHKEVCSKGDCPNWVWYVAGRELCHLKALQHAGDNRIIVSEIHDLYKVDTKYARALLEGCLDEEGDEENVFDEEDLMDDDVGLEMD